MNIGLINTSVNPLPAPINSAKLSENLPPQRVNEPVPPTSDPGSTVNINSGASADLTYTDPRLKQTGQTTDLKALLEESNRKAQEIVNLILPLVQQQGLNLAKVVSGEQKISADPKAIAAAKAAIAPDGEFGVQKTAERILSFAKAAIGGDPAKLDQIRAAVESGFKQAADILGGTLPDISQQTLKAIETEFDSWKSAGIPTGDAVSLAKK